MVSILIYFFVGIILGILFRSHVFINRVVHRITDIAIFILLFILGATIGSNKSLIQNFSSIGFEAVILAIGATFGSILATYPLSSIIQRKQK